MLFLRLWFIVIASVFFHGIVASSLPDIKFTVNESTPTRVVGNIVTDCAVYFALSVLKKYPGCYAWLISSPDYKECIDAYHAVMMDRGLLEKAPRWSCYGNNEFVEIAKAGLYPCSNEISTALLLLESDEEYKKAVMEVYPDSVEAMYEITES